MLKLNRDERSLIYAQLEENLDLYALRRTCKVFHREIPPISAGRAIILEECSQRSAPWLEWFRLSLPRKARLELVTELLDSLPLTPEKAPLRKVFRVFAQDLNFNQSDCRDIITILWRNACYASPPHWKIEYGSLFEILVESTSRPWVFNDFHLELFRLSFTEFAWQQDDWSYIPTDRTKLLVRYWGLPSRLLRFWWRNDTFHRSFNEFHVIGHDSILPSLVHSVFGVCAFLLGYGLGSKMN